MHLAEQIKSKFPNIAIEAGRLPAGSANGDPCVVIKKDGVKNILSFLKKDADFSFDVLMDLFSVDYLHWEEKEYRFEVVYNLWSIKKNHRLFVKALVPESDLTVDSAMSVWPAADWFEREVWDMFGIRFNGHPNLKRILMYEEFKGHALRKDYRYNERQPLIGPLN